MRQGGENDQRVNNDTAEIVAFWQRCDLAIKKMKLNWKKLGSVLMFSGLR